MRSILVVEDTADARDILARMIRLGGMVPVTAEDGHAALKALEKQVPDAVLLDLMMPEMNGVELLDKIRGDERWKALPVIVLTALSEGRLVQRAAELGVQDFILKGAINAVDLIDRIARNLKPDA
jgi:CheY-like chemotaxis protein